VGGDSIPVANAVLLGKLDELVNNRLVPLPCPLARPAGYIRPRQVLLVKLPASSQLQQGLGRWACKRGVDKAEVGCHDPVKLFKAAECFIVILGAK
jgi:hypothetical protein